MPTANPEIYGPGLLMREVSSGELSPGVCNLVLALREIGLFTTDSGDGSNYEAGMSCALPYPHAMICCPIGKADRVAEMVNELLAERPTLIDWPHVVEVLGAPKPENNEHLDDGALREAMSYEVVMIGHADAAAICERVGYTGYCDHDHD